MGIFFSAIFGLIGGFGLGLYLQNSGAFPGTSPITLLFPVVGMIVLVALNIVARRRRRTPA